jgi:sugar-phosphatase
VDSTQVVARQYVIWAKEHGLDSQAILENAHGVRTIEIVRRVAPHLDAEREALKIEEREAGDPDVRGIPGAIDLVKSIPGRRWGVVTSGGRMLATSRLRRLEIPTPPVLVTAEDVMRGKPAPDPYLKGAELLKLPPERCVVVEDAVAGIRAAHAAGMRVISLPSTYPEDDLREADAVVPGLTHVRVSVDGAGPHGDLVIRIA